VPHNSGLPNQGQTPELSQQAERAAERVRAGLSGDWRFPGCPHGALGQEPVLALRISNALLIELIGQLVQVMHLRSFSSSGSRFRPEGMLPDLPVLVCEGAHILLVSRSTTWSRGAHAAVALANPCRSIYHSAHRSPSVAAREHLCPICPAGP
jgi:hypothetical protein